MAVSTFLESSFEWVLLFASFIHRLPELIEWTITCTSAKIHHEVLSQKQRSQNYSKLYSHLPSFLFGICNDLFPSFQFFFRTKHRLGFCQRFPGKMLWQLKIGNFHKWSKMLPWSGHLLLNWCHVTSSFRAKDQPLRENNSCFSTKDSRERSTTWRVLQIENMKRLKIHQV